MSPCHYCLLKVLRPPGLAIANHYFPCCNLHQSTTVTHSEPSDEWVVQIVLVTLHQIVNRIGTIWLSRNVHEKHYLHGILPLVHPANYEKNMHLLCGVGSFVFSMIFAVMVAISEAANNLCADQWLICCQ